MNRSKSKRKHSDKENGTAKKRKSHESSVLYNDGTVFCELVSQCGISLKAKIGSPSLNFKQERTELDFDQAVCQRKLTLSFKRHNDYPEVVDTFLDGFQEYISEQCRFHLSLLPCIASQKNVNSFVGVNVPSIIRLLLGVDLLQTKLLNMLLEKFPEFEGDEDSIFCHEGGRIDLPKLLLTQFCWLDHIVDGKAVTDKLFEIFEVTSLEIQRDIIACMPEMLEDCEHSRAAAILKDMLLQTSALTVPILDAMTNLNVTQDLLDDVRTTVLQTIKSVELQDLPVVIKFLLQSVNNQTAVDVVNEIRTELDFHSLSSTDQSNNNNRPLNRMTSGDMEKKNTEGLILDAIRGAIRFQRSIAEAWIKSIDSVKIPIRHQVLDVLVLVILHFTNRKKPVESLFRNKIRNGAFTEALIHTTFTCHYQVLKEYFLSVISISEVLLRSPEPKLCSFAQVMYKEAFVASDSYYQQEIVGNLVTHIGSSVADEIDASLDILSDLVDEHLSKMMPFTVFVKGVIDYLDNLNISQIRKLYSILSILGFTNVEDSFIQDDLHILIMKQLSNNNPKYKRMGVIGAIMVVKNIAPKRSPNSAETEASELSDGLYQQVVNLLQLVRSSSNKMPEATALFMDELSTVVQKGLLNRKVEDWISENVISDFQDDYVVDVEENQPTDGESLSSDLQFGLDDASEGSIAINMVQLVSNNTFEKIKKTSDKNKIPHPICLAPHFRLLSICESRQQNGDLEGIDALLGCPLHGIQGQIIDKISSLSIKEKELICSILFYTLNWFREVINAFASQPDAEMKGKVITRLQNITDAQKTLQTCLAKTPGYNPQPANFDSDSGSIVHVLPTATGGKKGKKGGKKVKSSKGKDTSSRDESDDNSKDSSQIDAESQAGNENQDNDEEEVHIDLSTYRPCFRELDISVFTILNVGQITKDALDTEMNTKQTTKLELQPAQLDFLLDDLSKKLEHALLPASKRKSFLKTKTDKNIGFSHLDVYSSKEIAKKAVKLLPALCEHLESVSGFFQALIAENDGLIDGPGRNTPEAKLMTSCFHLILKCILCLFSWCGFAVTENRDLLKEALYVLTARIKQLENTQISFKELLKMAFEYLCNLASTVPTIEIAVSLVKLLTLFSERDESLNLSTKLESVSEDFLKQEWFDINGQKHKGAKFNESLLVILKSYLSCSSDSLIVVEGIVSKGVKEIMNGDKNSVSETLPSLSVSTFPVFYRAMFSELIDCIKCIAPKKQTDTREINMEKLIHWNLTVRIFNILVNLIKVFDMRSNLGVALRCGRQFIDIFLRLGMPLLDYMFKSNREDVQGLLKNLQLSTRILQHMCGHSKIMKDISLTNQIPPLKKSLESFVYRVKAMLTVNKCLEAFWMGNLKNKNLKGEEILSQASMASTVGGDDSDDSADAAPDDQDEEESDVEMEKESVASNDKPDDDSGPEDSYSEIF